MQDITKTFIVYAEGESRPLEDLKQSLQQRNDCIVTVSNLKNSFLLKMICKPKPTPEPEEGKGSFGTMTYIIAGVVIILLVLTYFKFADGTSITRTST